MPGRARGLTYHATSVLPCSSNHDSMIRRQFKTQDDVTLNAVETGNPLGQAVLFVHGLSQSWRSWRAQFADPQLRERFRLVALDLRGHGESQGAFGAIDQEANPLVSLS